MSRKICQSIVLAAALFANVGCCAWSDRWCNRGQHAAAPQQFCTPAPVACMPVQQPQACYPTQGYAPPPQQGFQRAPYCP